jgi:hypothetical protein
VNTLNSQDRRKTMIRKIAPLLVIALGSLLFGLVQAGDLEPPGSPAPTMVTLQEIYDKLDECTGGGSCGVPKTGQTGCWDGSGWSISCNLTGQDGEYQVGVSVGPRFTDNGDGTVTDNLTSLIWLQDADCFGQREWTNALSDANGLADGSCSLTDGSVAGDWRLPNVKELQSLIDFGQYLPALPAGHPFSGVQSGGYWSSTSRVYNPGYAWGVYLSYGYVNGYYKTNTNFVWPVRGGQ